MSESIMEPFSGWESLSPAVCSTGLGGLPKQRQWPLSISSCQHPLPDMTLLVCSFLLSIPGYVPWEGREHRGKWQESLILHPEWAPVCPARPICWYDLAARVSLLKITDTENRAKGSGKLQGQSLTSLWERPRKALKLEFSAGILGAPLPGIGPKWEKSRMWTKMNPAEFIYNSKNLETI